MDKYSEIIFKHIATNFSIILTINHVLDDSSRTDTFRSWEYPSSRSSKEEKDYALSPRVFGV